jgi:hypothetical protein
MNLVKTDAAMIFHIDDEKGVIGIEVDHAATDETPGITQVRERIERLFPGSPVLEYHIVFRPAARNLNISNAMAVKPEDIEYRITKAHHITDI